MKWDAILLQGWRSQLTYFYQILASADRTAAAHQMHTTCSIMDPTFNSSWDIPTTPLISGAESESELYQKEDSA